MEARAPERRSRKELEGRRVPAHLWAMKKNTARRFPRFYVINPLPDRRLDPRFDSSENVVMRFSESLAVYPAVAHEVSRRGLRLESSVRIELGTTVQISFPNAIDHIQAFGQVVWTRERPGKARFDSGVRVEAWHGIFMGRESWKKYAGIRPKGDRRARRR